MPKSRAEAAMPSTASTLRSQLRCPDALMRKKKKRRGCRRAFCSPGGLLARRDLLQLCVKLVEHLPRVGQLDARLLDPVLDDRAALLVRLGDHGGAGLLDVGARRLERVVADLVRLVPGLAIGARGIL